MMTTFFHKFNCLYILEQSGFSKKYVDHGYHIF